MENGILYSEQFGDIVYKIQYTESAFNWSLWSGLPIEYRNTIAHEGHIELFWVRPSVTPFGVNIKNTIEDRLILKENIDKHVSELKQVMVTHMTQYKEDISNRWNDTIQRLMNGG